MQSTVNEPDSAAAWEQIAPLLDDAMGRLGETDRNAVVLHFFENKTAREVAAALQLTEAAAHKRIRRALEKLRKLFYKRGVMMTASLIGGTMALNSVHAAPAGLVKTISTVALAKGAAAGGSTLTLVKGALKIMAWTKMKTAVAIVAVLLLAAGTAITVSEIRRHLRYPWQVPKVNPGMIRKFPPQVVIVPTIFDKPSRYADHTTGGGAIGICQSITNLVQVIDGHNIYRMVFASGLPTGRFDYFARVGDADPGKWRKELSEQLKTKLGVSEIPEVRNADVLLLELRNPNAGGLQPPGRLRRSMNQPSNMTGISGSNYVAHFASPISSLQDFLQVSLEIPVIDQSGITGLHDFKLMFDYGSDREQTKDNIKKALYNQLGFELVPTNMPVEMLVVEKAR